MGDHGDWGGLSPGQSGFDGERQSLYPNPFLVVEGESFLRKNI